MVLTGQKPARLLTTGEAALRARPRLRPDPLTVQRPAAGMGDRDQAPWLWTAGDTCSRVRKRPRRVILVRVLISAGSPLARLNSTAIRTRVRARRTTRPATITRLPRIRGWLRPRRSRPARREARSRSRAGRSSSVPAKRTDRRPPRVRRYSPHSGRLTRKLPFLTPGAQADLLTPGAVAERYPLGGRRLGPVVLAVSSRSGRRRLNMSVRIASTSSVPKPRTPLGNRTARSSPRCSQRRPAGRQAHRLGGLGLVVGARRPRRTDRGSRSSAARPEERRIFELAGDDEVLAVR
jgi:hypothetical protein